MCLYRCLPHREKNGNIRKNEASVLRLAAFSKDLILGNQAIMKEIINEPVTFMMKFHAGNILFTLLFSRICFCLLYTSDAADE